MCHVLTLLSAQFLKTAFFSISKSQMWFYYKELIKLQFNQWQLKTRNKYCLSGKDITFRIKIRVILLCTINPHANKIILDTLLKPLHIISVLRNFFSTEAWGFSCRVSRFWRRSGLSCGQHNTLF